MAVASIYGDDERGDVLQPRIAHSRRIVVRHGAYGRPYLEADMFSRMSLPVRSRYGSTSFVAMAGDAPRGTERRNTGLCAWSTIRGWCRGFGIAI
jgi:hypothetical protein